MHKKPFALELFTRYTYKKFYQRTSHSLLQRSSFLVVFITPQDIYILKGFQADSYVRSFDVWDVYALIYALKQTRDETINATRLSNLQISIS